MSELGVVVVVKHFMLGGLERVVVQQCTMLLEAGFKVTVLVLYNDRDNCLLVELPDSVQVVVWEHTTSKSIERLIDGQVVFLELADGSLEPEIRPLLRSARKIVRFCHSDYSHLRSMEENIRDKNISEASEDVVIAVGEQAEIFLIGDVGLSAKDVKRLDNVIEPWSEANDGLWRSLDFSATKYLLSVQSMYAHKGHRSLVEGVALANQNHAGSERVKVVCVGDGDELLNVRQCAVDCGVEKDIVFLGGIWNREIVHALMRDCWAFVSASKHEGLPISVLEALRVRRGLILSDIPAHRQGAMNSNCTWFAPGDEVEISRAVRQAWGAKRVTQSPSLGDVLVRQWEQYRRMLVELVNN